MNRGRIGKPIRLKHSKKNEYISKKGISTLLKEIKQVKRHFPMGGGSNKTCRLLKNNDSYF